MKFDRNAWTDAVLRDTDLDAEVRQALVSLSACCDDDGRVPDDLNAISQETGIDRGSLERSIPIARESVWMQDGRLVRP